MNKNELIISYEKVHNNKYDYSLIPNIVKNKDKVKIICPEHGEFEQRVDSHKKSGCPMCKRKQLTTKTFIERSKKIFSEYDYSLVEYINSKIKVKIICPEHGEFEKIPEAILYKHEGCPYCNNRKTTIDMFIAKSKQIYGINKYNYNLVEYKNNYTKIKLICPKHGIFETLPNNHLSGKDGCPKCNGRYVTTEDFINKAKNIHRDKYDYDLVDYKNNRTKVKIICKKHNNIFKQAPSEHLSGNGCPLCNESKGENKIAIYLDDNNIVYNRQHKFDRCMNKRKLPFDFYLPEYKLCIEYDGIQHFESILYWGGDESFKKTKYNDNIKNEYCKNNNIKLIRISYKDKDNIKKILNTFFIYKEKTQ